MKRIEVCSGRSNQQNTNPINSKSLNWIGVFCLGASCIILRKNVFVSLTSFHSVHSTQYILLGQPRCLPSFIPNQRFSILSLTYFYNTFLFIQFKQNQSIINNSNQMSLIGCVDWWFVCYYAPFGAAQPHNSISFVQRHKRNWELCWMASCICFIHKLIILSIWLIQRHQSNWERIDLFAHSAHLQQINTSSTHQPLNKSKLFCFVLCGGWSGLVDCCCPLSARNVFATLNTFSWAASSYKPN